jgi:hypothetical protein
MNFRLLHPPLDVFIIKKLKHRVQGLSRIFHNIGIRPTLMVFEEPLQCDFYILHLGLWFIDLIAKLDEKFIACLNDLRRQACYF